MTRLISAEKLVKVVKDTTVQIANKLIAKNKFAKVWEHIKATVR
ncbi:MAG: hypothetical protein RLZZ04_217 [Cyanobacteriota bacterium]|jgi:hypothetical protein